MPTATRTVNDALAFAQRESGSPSRNWHNACLVFVRSCWGIGSRNASAYADWLACPEHAKHPGNNPDDAPVGAALYYKGTGPYGHIMLAAHERRLVQRPDPRRQDRQGQPRAPRDRVGAPLPRLVLAGRRRRPSAVPGTEASRTTEADRPEAGHRPRRCRGDREGRAARPHQGQARIGTRQRAQADLAQGQGAVPMTRRRWAAYIAAGAALDAWAAFGNGGETFSTSIRRSAYCDTKTGQVAFLGLLFLGAAWFGSHILDPRKIEELLS